MRKSKNKDVQQGLLFPEYEEAVTIVDLKTKITQLEKENKKLKEKAKVFDTLVSSKSFFTTTVVAKSFGWSAVRLNKYLSEKRIQYKRGEVWVLYAKYADQGYTNICWHQYDVDLNHKAKFKAHTYWTTKGLLFIRSLLKTDNLLPE